MAFVMAAGLLTMGGCPKAIKFHSKLTGPAPATCIGASPQNFDYKVHATHPKVPKKEWLLDGKVFYKPILEHFQDTVLEVQLSHVEKDITGGTDVVTVKVTNGIGTVTMIADFQIKGRTGTGDVPRATSLKYDAKNTCP